MRYELNVLSKSCSENMQHIYRRTSMRISIKLQNNFNEITLQHGWPPINLLYIFRTYFFKNDHGVLLLTFDHCCLFRNMRLLSKPWISDFKTYVNLFPSLCISNTAALLLNKYILLILFICSVHVSNHFHRIVLSKW